MNNLQIKDERVSVCVYPVAVNQSKGTVVKQGHIPSPPFSIYVN